MKYVLVTGACGGMGKAAVSAYRDAGYFVFAMDRHPFGECDGVISVQADITDENDIIAAFRKISEITDSLYAIVHFAGVYMLDSLVEISEEEYIRAFNINVFGAYRINKIFLPLLSKGSRIVITTSELAPLDPLPFTGLYAITKSALDKYAYSLRMELQLLGIYVSVIRPGAVKTDMLGASTSALDRFCDKSALYTCNANRFKSIVNKVEARHVPPCAVAKKSLKALNRRNPRHIYKLNRNPLLLMLNILPRSWQTHIIGLVLREKKRK